MNKKLFFSMLMLLLTSEFINAQRTVTGTRNDIFNVEMQNWYVLKYKIGMRNIT